MSRTLPSPLETHLAQSTTTWAFLVKIARRDGITLCLTDHDRDIPYGGDVYTATMGGVVSAASSVAGLELANLNIAGTFRVGGLQRSDLLAGRYDQADITVHRVNWKDPSQGVLETFFGYFGEVKFGDREFNVDCFGLEHKLLQKIGETYAKTCKAELGDARCTVPLADYSETGTVTAVHSQREIECTLTNLNAHPITEEDWFAGGYLQWSTGNNTGLFWELKTSSESAGTFTLAGKQDAPFSIQAGDTFSIVAGCRKRWQDCTQKFNNGDHFRGFKDLPGPDAIKFVPRMKLGV